MCVLFAACPFVASSRTMMRASSSVDERSYTPVIRRHKSFKLMTKVGSQNDVWEGWVEQISPKLQLPDGKENQTGQAEWFVGFYIHGRCCGKEEADKSPISLDSFHGNFGGRRRKKIVELHHVEFLLLTTSVR